MKQFFQTLKTDPFWRSLSIAVIACVVWFVVSPTGFKSAWSRNPLVAAVIKEHNAVEQKSKFASISLYYPYFLYFSGIVAGSEEPKPELMDTYYAGQPYIFRMYYQKAVEMFPDDDAAHYLLGFCDYYKGDIDLARAEYEKSITVDPYFFWSYYNLGVIDFQQKDFIKSGRVLAKAFSLKNEYVFEVLSQRFLYGQIWQGIANPSPIIGNNLNEGQEGAALVLTACFIKTGQYAQALEVIRSAKGNLRYRELWEGLYKIALNKQGTTGNIDRLIQAKTPVRLF